MYNDNFRNQAVKEVKNGSTVAQVAKRFNLAVSTVKTWVDKYDEKMHEMLSNDLIDVSKWRDETQEPKVIKKNLNGIRLNSIKVVIDGKDLNLTRNDVEKMMRVFKAFELGAEVEG